MSFYTLAIVSLYSLQCGELAESMSRRPAGDRGGAQLKPKGLIQGTKLWTWRDGRIGHNGVLAQLKSTKGFVPGLVSGLRGWWK
jgi:hypothetical protein